MVDTSRFKLFGTPIHTVINDVPASVLPLASVCDLALTLTGKRDWGHTAYRLLQMGNIAALAAAAFGVADYLALPKRHEPLQRLGKAHLALNAVALPVFALCQWRRRSRPTRPSTPDMLLLLAANVCLAVSAELGSRMVYEHGAGVTRGRRSRVHLQAPLPDLDHFGVHAAGWDDASEQLPADADEDADTASYVRATDSTASDDGAARSAQPVQSQGNDGQAVGRGDAQKEDQALEGTGHGVEPLHGSMTGEHSSATPRSA